MSDHDYYKVLEVSREASDDEIRKSYKKLARKYHPDVMPDDKDADERFKQVQEAYAVLGDADKREQYDRYGAAFQQSGRGPGGFNWSAGPGGAGPIDLGDLFGGQIDLGNLFGGSGKRGGFGGFSQARPQARGSVKGQNIKLEIEVPFQLAAVGGKHMVQLQREGKTERLTVKIPAGVENGSVIRLSGQGHPSGAGGSAGDLLLALKVAAHPFFRRQGNNLLLDVPLSPTEAVLGAKVEVPTLTEGMVSVTVPPGTSTDTKLRLRGKGIPHQKTKQPGDQIVVIKIVVPKEVDLGTKELYEKLAESARESPRDGLW